MKVIQILLLLPLLAACSSSGTLTSAASTPTSPAPTSTATLQPTETSIPATPTNTPIPTLASAAAFPDPANYGWTSLAEGLIHPVDIQNAGDNSGRLFIVEQAGRILIYQDGKVLPAPFLDIVAEVGSSGSEQGLLGLAFHPDYEEDGLFFVNYTDVNGNTVIARFHVSNDPSIADAGSETPILSVDQPFRNHNGGVLAFGQDGYLYAGLGDGGSGGDPFGNGQKTDTLLGKILRLDVNSGDTYSIPADNPFGNEIWAYGLRNPWRFSFDPATQDLYIGDVGQGAWEEIDYLPAGSPGGANFGWNIMEGDQPYNGGSQEGLIAPVAVYGHAATPGGCSVTGGHVYRGQALPEWQGIYLYGDYCTGTIWGLLRTGAGWQNQVLFETDFSISSFGVDEAGELYLANLQGAIYRLEKK
jgi:glucose/arabinose dehydrogenase